MWFKYNQEQRINEVYSKFSISEFWDWWCNKEQKVMEIRIKDFKIIKEIAKKYNIPYSASGVYIWNISMLKLIIMEVRKNNVTAWFGVNSRKTNYNKWGNKSFGGSDCNIQELGFIFIDIDRKVKAGPATNLDLEHCDVLANKILERLATQGWSKSFLKICSGNGVQLLIKLDYPIKLPSIDFDSSSKTFVENKEYNTIKNIIREGVGKDIVKYSRKFNEELQVEVDKSGLNMGRVAALPFTKNFKYGGFTWRGIVDLQKGENIGLSDYIMSKVDDIKVYETQNVFVNRTLSNRDKLKVGKLRDNILIKFMLENNLPEGMRNNYLFFQLKCLLRDSKFDLSSEEFKTIHKELERKYGALPMNLPDPKFGFDENIVNKYCIVNLMPPLYPLWPKRTLKLDMGIENITWEEVLNSNNIMELKVETEILEDLQICKDNLVPENKIFNPSIFKSFVKGCIQKYGVDKTKYYYEYIMLKFLCYN